MATPRPGDEGDELQRIFQLLAARTAGRATNEQVEAAVAQLLQRQQPAAAARDDASGKEEQEDKVGEEDKGEGRNDSDGDKDSKEADQSPSKARRSKQKSPSAAASPTETPPTSSRRRSSTRVQSLGCSSDTEKDQDDVAIEEDMEDYDNDDKAAVATTPTPEPEKETSSRKKHRGQKRKRGRPATAAPAMDWSIYRDIPLGKQGAQMLTAFGDGPQPHPAAVRAALLGSRRLVQVAIQDARCLRRRQREIFKTVQAGMRAYKAQKPVARHEWSAAMQFRASQQARKHDPLSHTPKCGFGLEELDQLFPEEMNAYSKWNDMHSASQEKKQADDDDDQSEGAAGGNNDKPKDDSKDTAAASHPEEEVAPLDPEGHLLVRAEQFDLRTDRMKKDWYLQFSNIRKGSFLPQRSTLTREEASWEDSNKVPGQLGQRKRGQEGGGWAHTPLIQVRFLHWVGFDPQSALPPPNASTTFALGFLAHDFFGRIVEKAILLRNQRQLAEKKKKSKGGYSNDGDKDEEVLNELQEGEQLTESDIAIAVEDPDVKPVPIYSTSADHAGEIGTQLYFGPGFEDRLEMEMEEMVRRKKDNASDGLTDEERQILEEETALFARLAATQPTSLDGIPSLMDSTTPTRDGDGSEVAEAAAGAVGEGDATL